MTVSKEDISTAIANLNDLTQRGAITWQPSAPIHLGESRGVAYQAKHEGRTLRIVEYTPPRVRGFYAGVPTFGDAIRRVTGASPDKEFVLEIIDDDSIPIFEFPKVKGIKDLFDTVKLQGSDVEGFIRSLIGAR